MKRRICLFGLSIVVGGFLLTSCVKNSNCEPMSTGCGTVDVCTSGLRAYYEYDGKKYYCDGLTDCDAAAEEVVSDMCY